MSFASGSSIWALLVGIDQYLVEGNLRGCVNDVEAMQVFLINQLNVPENHIRILTNKDATRQNIIYTFKEFLINNPAIKSNNQILFHYSGHGSRMRDPHGVEPDGYYEALVPHDSRTPDVYDIPDKTIAALLEELAAKKGDRKRLFLAPAGDLFRLPFEVLPTDDGRYLIDEYYISYLSTGRDVLRFEAPTTGQPTEPIVAADPDFNFGDSESMIVPENTKLLGRQSRDLDRGRWHFGHLPGTRQEGEQIAKMLTVQPWVQQAVLETRLKASRSPRILHIATHGFFLPDQKRDLNKEQFGLETIGGISESRIDRLLGAKLENPLLRSGLALAGANTWLKGSELPPQAEDGILTAEDVSGLDLLDTELVVLSACETGLGEVHTAEGVFGLRRSFVLAGAKTLVMSLWKVPDKQTQELMEKFYRRVLEGRSRTDALREAQLEMKAKYPNPLYWGAFICQGDPKPLQNNVSSRTAIITH